MVTDRHIQRLHRFDQQGWPKGQAAAKAGIDDKTARKYRRLGRLPSEVRMDHTWRTRPDPFAERLARARGATDAQPRPGSQDAVRVAATPLPRPFRRWPIAHLAATRQTVAGLVGAGQGSLLHPGASPRPAGRLRLHALHQPGHDHQRQSFRPSDLPLRADLLELGDRHDLLLRELREPQRGPAKRAVGTGRRAAGASHRFG